jgi:drug/metabolite transporter (DMT)-like permease
MKGARLAWAAWTAVCLIWGTTYLAIKVALETIPPFLMGGLRYVTAGLILAGILKATGRGLPPVRAWAWLGLLGFLLVALGNGGVVWAEQFIPSGLTAVLIGTTPFWMVGTEAAVNGSRHVSRAEWVGLAVGFAGIVLLVSPDLVAGGEGGRQFGLGVLAVQVACAGWATGSALTRRHTAGGGVLGVAAVQMFAGGMVMLAVGTALGEWPRLHFTATTAVMLVYLTVFGSLVAFAAYAYALRHLDVTVVSLYTYINPVIAVVLGTLLVGEPFGWWMAGAVAVILVGVVIVRMTSGVVSR